MSNPTENPRRSRFGDAIRNDAADPHPRYQQDAPEHQRARYVAAPLESRLSQPYDERYDDDRKNRPLPPPLSPTSRRDRGPYVEDARIAHRADNRAASRDNFDEERRAGGWDDDMQRHGHDQSHRRLPSPGVPDTKRPDRSEGPSSFPDHASQHQTRPVRIRRPQRPDDGGPTDLPSDVIRMERRDSDHNEFASSARQPERPRPSRRAASLLDRLSLDAGPSDPPPPSSLRDRVQIVPAKRDRDEMMRSYSGGGESMDAEDIGGGPDSGRRPKKRSGRPKGRRGRNSGS
jgi:hypothetical protein